MKDLWVVCVFPRVPDLLTVKALSGMAIALLQSTLPLVLQSTFALTSRQNGYVLSYTGIVGMLGAFTLCSSRMLQEP
jgi:hypothetical protein